jgi:hypothetical protein
MCRSPSGVTQELNASSYAHRRASPQRACAIRADLMHGRDFRAWGGAGATSRGSMCQPMPGWHVPKISSAVCSKPNAEVESWQPFKLNHRGSFPPRIKIERASRTSHAVREVPRGDISPERMQGPGSRISYSIRADAHCCSDRSGTHFEDHIERRLGRAAEAPEARFSRDLTQSAFTRLGAEPQAHFLRE